jgi:hypothetical protein
LGIEISEVKKIFQKHLNLKKYGKIEKKIRPTIISKKNTPKSLKSKKSYSKNMFQKGSPKNPTKKRPPNSSINSNPKKNFRNLAKTPQKCDNQSLAPKKSPLSQGKTREVVKNNEKLKDL